MPFESPLTNITTEIRQRLRLSLYAHSFIICFKEEESQRRTTLHSIIEGDHSIRVSARSLYTTPASVHFGTALYLRGQKEVDECQSTLYCTIDLYSISVHFERASTCFTTRKRHHSSRLWVDGLLLLHSCTYYLPKKVVKITMRIKAQ